MIEKAYYIDSDDKEKYSELKVLQSAAGWYIGTTYKEDEGFESPGSRDSGYFKSKELAQYALDNEEWIQRDHP
jgi:hypothetical protein